MRIGVVGAGAIGGTIAALLTREGHEVTVVARGAQLEAIRQDGLRLTGAWGDVTARMRATDRLQTPPELAIVCTKAQDSAAALEAHAPLLRGIPVLVVQNGLEGVATASRVLPASDVVGGLALYATSYLAPGTVTVTAAGSTVVGTADPRRMATAELFVATLGEVMPTQLTTNFAGAQWTKLIVNQVNALPAITGLSAQQTILDRSLGLVVTASMREAVRVGLASGIRFAPVQGLSQALLRIFARSPLAAGLALPTLMARRMGSQPNPGSTLQSVRRGQRTEIDYLNGAVVRAARTLGRDARINRILVGLVHEVEQGRPFLTPVEVAAALHR